MGTRLRRLAPLVGLATSVVLASFCVCPASIAAANGGESPAASDSTQSMFILELEREHPLTVSRIEPIANGLVVITRTDGEQRTISAHRIVAIWDENGYDRRDEVLLRGHAIGATPPQSTPPSWVAFRLRGGPRAKCRSYALTEISALWRITGRNRLDGQTGTYYAADWGFATNVGKSYSVGGTLFLGADESRQDFGLRARARYWLSPRATLDLAPGIVLATSQVGGDTPGLPGVVGQVGLTLDDRFGITLQILRTRHRASFDPWLGGSGADTERTEYTWHAGLRLGGAPGMVGTAAATFLTNLVRGPGAIKR